MQLESKRPLENKRLFRPLVSKVSRALAFETLRYIFLFIFSLLIQKAFFFESRHLSRGSVAFEGVITSGGGYFRDFTITFVRMNSDNLLKAYRGLLIPSNSHERSIERGLFVFPDWKNYWFFNLSVLPHFLIFRGL